MLFAILTLLSALTVAGVSGWFSIAGIMSIYAGAPLHAALVMGVVLEGAKLVTTSWLYRNWSYASWKLKIPLIYFTGALMIATSIGVFGFLTKAHLEQGASTIDNIAKVERLDQQISREKSIIADNEKVISQLDTTINSFLGNDKTDRALAVRRAQAPQRKQLREEIQAAQKQIDAYSEEKLKLTSEVRALQLEVGPIRYIAEVLYGTNGNETAKIETAVRLFTLLIVSTLDPLAVILLIAANHSLLRRQNEKNKKSVEESEVPKSTDKGIELSSITVKEKEDIQTPTKGNFVKETEGPSIDINDIQSSAQSNQESRDNSQMDETLHGKEITESPFGVEFTDDTSVKKFFENGREIARRLDNNESLAGIDDVTIRQVEIKDDEPFYISDIVEINDEGNDFVVTEDIISQSPSMPLPVIISPVESKITIPEPEKLLETSTVGKSQLTQTQPWAHNEEVLAEILGNQPHFVPIRLNEKIEHRSIEGTASPISDRPETKTTKVEQEGQSQNKEETADVANIQYDSPGDNKYPKALSWLKEFKGN